MNPTISFSRFAYKATKPRLTFYQQGDKENRPGSTPKPRSPINAIQDSDRCVRHCTPKSCEKKVSVVPETPDDELPMKRANTSKGLAMASGKRKRWRVPSSSEEEIKSESDSRETRKGGARGTKCGLFSSTVVSKRKKMCGESTYPINENAFAVTTSKDSTESEPWKEFERKSTHVKLTAMQDEISKRSRRKNFKGRIVQKRITDLCSDTDSEFGQSHIGEDRTDSEVDEDVCVRQPRPKPAPSIPSPTEDGWLTRRGRSHWGRKPQSSANSISAIEGDVGRLKELFPQHSEEYLRGILAMCSDVDGAIANILASDGIYCTTLNTVELL